jgi:hypothetical protein
VGGGGLDGAGFGVKGEGVVAGCDKVVPLFTGPPRGCLQLCCCHTADFLISLTDM